MRPRGASRNASHGASVGVTLGAGAQTGLSFQVGVQSGKGRDNQNSVTHTPTVVTGGKAANITSGGDLSLNGAVVEAEQVKAKVGGDLKITTLQDVSAGQSDQSSSGFGLSVCIPPICGGAIVLPSASAAGASAGGSYVSPTTQAGIKAGDGGFDVDVAGNTTLVGGVIESTQAAVDAKKNSFVTGGTLTLTDLQNASSSSGEAYGVSATLPIGYGTKPVEGVEPTPEQQAAGIKGTPAQPSGFYWTPPKDANGNSVANNTPTGSAGVGSYGSGQTSVTKAGISGIAGDESVRTGDLTSAGTLVKDWDTQAIIKDVQAQVQITQQFGAETTKLWAQVANEQLQAALDREDNDAIKCWSADGLCRLAGHTVIGGSVGGVNGAVGAAIATASTDSINKALNSAGLKDSTVRDSVAALLAVALGYAGGTGTGAATAFNEVTNNYLTSKQWTDLASELKKCNGEPGCERDIYARYQKLSKEQDEQMRSACAEDRQSAACRGHMAAAIGGSATQRDLVLSGEESGLPQEFWAGSDFNASAMRIVRDATVDDFRVACKADPVCAAAKGEESMVAAFLVALDFVPIAGDLKGFYDAEAPLDYAMAAIGTLGPVGDGFKVLIKGTKFEDKLKAVGDDVAGSLGKWKPEAASASQLDSFRVEVALNSPASGSKAGREAPTIEDALSGGSVTSTPGTVIGSRICVDGCAITGLTPSEQALIQQIKAGQDAGGDLTEKLLTLVSERTGMKVLDGGKYGGNKGFDLVLQNSDGSVTVIVDAKQLTPAGSMRVSTKGETNQLSPNWVDGVLSKIKKDSPAYKAIITAQETGTLKTAVGGVNRTTGELIVVPVTVPNK